MYIYHDVSSIITCSHGKLSPLFLTSGPTQLTQVLRRHLKGLQALLGLAPTGPLSLRTENTHPSIVHVYDNLSMGQREADIGEAYVPIYIFIVQTNHNWRTTFLSWFKIDVWVLCKTMTV